MIKKFLAAVLMIVVVGWAFEVYSLDTQNMRQLTRGQLWTGFRNEGTQGGVWDDRSSRGAPRLTVSGHGQWPYAQYGGCGLYRVFRQKERF